MPAITFAPRRGAILLCDFDMARVHPEMDKERQAVVVSIAPLNHKHATSAGHCTVVPISATEPKTIGPEDIPIPYGKYWSFKRDSWARCKMVHTVSHTRLSLLLRQGRLHPSEFMDAADMQRIMAGLKFVLDIT
jgi:uncharacterized protein YifN (PemK superfamily)